MSSSTPHSTTQTDEPQLSEDDATEAPADESDPAEALSLNVVFDILKNTRRRRVLHLLTEEDGPTTLGDMAERIAAVENDKPRAQLNAQERKRVYVGLYQCHLPRMDDADVIEFDENRGTVEIGSHAPQVYEYLEAATEDDQSIEWPRFYVLYGMSGLAVGAVLAYGAPGAVRLAGVALLLLGVVLLAAINERVDGS